MDDKQRDRLAELRQADIEREAKLQEETELRELESRELAAALEAKGARRGHDFEVISNPLGGVYGLRKPDTRAIRNWEQADEKKRINLEWLIGLLRHYIEPQDKAILWAQTCAQRPGLCWQTAEKFVELMGVDRDAVAKK